MLEVQDLTVRFGGLRAVSNVSFRVEPRQVVGLIGPNGAGKTTLFNAITGFRPPDSGSVRYQAAELVGLKPHAIAARGVARTFQNLQLFKSMTVTENILVAMHRYLKYPTLASAFWAFGTERQEKQAIAKAHELATLLGLGAVLNRKASDLPFAQEKLVEIARALALQPSLLLLDEPASGMNPSEKVVLRGLIQQIREQFGVTILLIEHDMGVVMNLCERIVVLNFGETIAEGTPEAVRADRRVREAYLGVEGAGAQA